MLWSNFAFFLQLSFLKLKKKPSINFGEMEFNFIYLSILKDYLDLEFDVLKDKLSFEYDLDRIIDDWVSKKMMYGFRYY